MLLLLLPFLLFSLLLVSLLLLPFLLLPLLLLLLLIGLPKHYLRRHRDQSKAKQKHSCLPGLSKYGCNYREKNRLMRRTFRHRCWFGVDDVALDKDYRKTLRTDRSRDTLHNHLGAALHRKDTPEQGQCTQRLGKEMFGKVFTICTLYSDKLWASSDAVEDYKTTDAVPRSGPARVGSPTQY